ncbi:MAG: MMPL family transporter [Mycobacterium sp.]
MDWLARVQTARRSGAVLLIGVFAILGALFALLPKSMPDAVPPQGAPPAAESTKVAGLLKEFPDADQTAALVVFATSDGAQREVLTDPQRAAIDQRAAALAGYSTAPRAVRPLFSKDGTTALITVPVRAQSGTTAIVAQADSLRQTAGQGLPGGMRAWLTGPVGFQSDTITSFAGADVRLLLTTASVVAVLLIVTYRSPVLWMVPLAIVGTADGLARFVVAALADAYGLPVDASILGILSVLVFGAGTNYALLLIARYREELLAEHDTRRAMRTAVAAAGPAIFASAGTVALSLLMLLFATLAGNRALGAACAVGIAIALVLVLGVLPAALVVCGRKVFWPFIPRYVEPKNRGEGGHAIWGRIGSAVQRRPWWIGGAAVVLIMVLSAGLSGASIGLSQTDQFVGNPESVRAQHLLIETFPADSGPQLVVLARDAEVSDAVRIAGSVDGVTSTRAAGNACGWTKIDVTAAGTPQSDAAFATVKALRAAYASRRVDAGRALVGGADAAALDQHDAAARDRVVIIPLILAVVAGVLLVLLRSLVAPLCLIVTVIATYVASLGSGNWLFHHVFGFEAFDTQVLLYAFLFLVALGVDYNIFLATRAREQRLDLGAREAMRYALTRTGGVITSAGILLAAVFVVLGVLPVVALAQIGTIVCIGVLLDTLVVRTLLVPALASVLGERFWWPAARAATRSTSH